MKKPDAQVVIKGEVHSSQEDLKEEIELIKHGFDVLVLEGAEDEPAYTLSNLWYHTASGITFWLLDPIYQSKDPLIQVAKAQGIEVIRTRKSDSKVLANTSAVSKVIAFIFFLFVTLGGLFIGVQTNFWLGYGLFMLGIILPPIYIRRQNMRDSAGRQNRDKIIADIITEAAQNGASVLAVIGSSHVDGVRDHLPNSVDVEYKLPKNPIKSREFFQNLSRDICEFALLSLGLYFVIIHSIELLIRIFA